MEVISWKNMPIFIEIIILLIRQNTIPNGQKALSMKFGHTSDKGRQLDYSTTTNAPMYLLLGMLVLLLPFIPGSKYLLPAKQVNFMSCSNTATLQHE